MKENKNLHRLNTSLHEKNHFLSLKQAEFEELINAEQTKSEELQNKLDDLEYELTKSRMRNGKLENVLVDTQVNTLLKPQELHLELPLELPPELPPELLHNISN